MVNTTKSVTKIRVIFRNNNKNHIFFKKTGLKTSFNFTFFKNITLNYNSHKQLDFHYNYVLYKGDGACSH